MTSLSTKWLRSQRTQLWKWPLPKRRNLARKNAAVKGIMPSEPAPTVIYKEAPAKGLFAKLKALFFDEAEETPAKPEPKRHRHDTMRDNRRRNGRRGEPERVPQEGSDATREAKDVKETKTRPRSASAAPTS